MVSSTALLTRMPDSEKESLLSAGVGGGGREEGKMSESELHVKENNRCLSLEMTFMSLLCAGDLRSVEPGHVLIQSSVAGFSFFNSLR